MKKEKKKSKLNKKKKNQKYGTYVYFKNCTVIVSSHQGYHWRPGRCNVMYFLC